MRVLVAIVLAGCLPSSEYRCDDDNDCGAGGQCQPTGFCSFADSTCSDPMQRYGEGAGSLSNDCVGAGNTASNCPATYMLVADATPGHRYRRVNDKRTWLEHASDCGDDSSTARVYLAVPNTATELEYIGQAMGNNKVWVGISDRVTEGVFVEATPEAAVATFLPWKQGAPDTNGNNDKDCVLAESESELVDDSCDADYFAVCECEE